MMRKYILVNFCGDCPYSDGSGRDKSWYCMEPTQIDSYGIGTRLGGNSRETLDNIPGWCPLEDMKGENPMAPPKLDDDDIYDQGAYFE